MSPYIKTDEKKHYDIDENPNQQQYNPWSVFPGLRFDGYYEGEPHQQNPYDFNPPMQQPNYNDNDTNNEMPNEYNNNFNPWNVFPAFRNTPPRNERNPNPKKSKPRRKDGKKEPSLKYIPAPVIKDNIGKIISTYIPGYGRVNVYIKGINRDGMVHLVIIEPEPKDYIYIHNSDMVGIYPPTL
ncbi:hypothetical protein SH1V18_05230 [Vallitalea longa]|uniref:Uncharacterized protein n=1 Tax=Vallitalea longa TaxID=2936439 RepID=A0A9W5Y943_9FIRM|nr:hypothetical protein [Vallitalea longa]GKX28043.1 hypothetical protein SH1V18_05230 [Vallitalea longa]